MARRICSNTKCDGNYNIADIHKKIRDPETGEDIEYNLPPLSPKVPNVCDKCGSSLIVRKEDGDEEMIKKRIGVYEKQSKPVLDHFQGKIKIVRIHMNNPPDVIVKEIVSKLEDIGIKR